MTGRAARQNETVRTKMSYKTTRSAFSAFRLKNAGGIANSDMSSRHILRYYSSCSDDGAISYVYPLQDDGSRSHEYATTDFDWLRSSNAGLPVVAPTPFAFGYVCIVIKNHRP